MCCLAHVDDIHGNDNDYAESKDENENGNEKIARGVHERHSVANHDLQLPPAALISTANQHDLTLSIAG